MNETAVEVQGTVSGSEHWYDSQTGGLILNDTAVADEEVMNALASQHPEYRQLAAWASASTRRSGGIFERDRYVTPERIFDQFKLAQHACDSDDVVSGVLESTEALAFSKMSVAAEEEDEEDIWNQIAANLNMDGLLRQMWRELFTVSQFYAVTWWDRKDFKVRGKSDKGVTRKKTFKNLLVPVGVTLLDPLKVVPVGDFMFNQEKLAYIASREQGEQFDEVLAGTNTTDLMVLNLIERRYEPSREEKKHLAEMTGVNVDNLFILNENRVWRHTATRPDYMRFATCRMKSVFELLDLKNQLREMDRAHLVGGTNFIILVKKGSDEMPAKATEVQALAAQVRASARVPVIVGDHRIEIEIITPKQDMVLKPERYNTIDARVTARLYQIFMTGNYAAGAKGDDSIKLARVVARGLEARRHMMRRDLEKHLFFETFDRNDQFTSEPKLRFHPKRIALDFDPNVATYLQDLRDRGDISRETMLQELDLSQPEEARQREREAEHYDDVFAPVNVPFSTPLGDPRMGTTPGKPVPAGSDQKAPPGNTRNAGRVGGRKNGGGSNPASSQPNDQRVKAIEEDGDEL